MRSRLGLPIVHPDVNLEEFERGWRRIPLTDRLMMWCLLPVVILGRLFGGPRMLWDRSMEVHDLPTSEEEDIAEALPELDEAFLGTRDERLPAALCELHRERGHETIEVAVVYGAGHMPAVVQGMLTRYGYRPPDSGLAHRSGHLTPASSRDMLGAHPVSDRNGAFRRARYLEMIANASARDGLRGSGTAACTRPRPLRWGA